MRSGACVNVDNAVSTFPIVNIPNICVGSVVPMYFSRVRMGVGTIYVVYWVERAAGLSYLCRSSTAEAIVMIVENTEIVLAILQIQVGDLAVLLCDGDLIIKPIWVSAIINSP